jgi:hypothetical protein
VGAEAKTERNEIPLTTAGFDFPIEFRQLGPEHYFSHSQKFFLLPEEELSRGITI